MAPSNALPIHGNEKTMNLNSLVLANIQASPYFKVSLYELKTYHQVIDEIYYKVNHLEPWEKGSRKIAGQTGMCGGVRGVGAGGIVSSAYCLLYKLYTLRLTRKQLIGLCTHQDSTFIRALGLMYIRYTQPPQSLWDWYEPYLDDEEEVDAKAGGGNNMTIGEISQQMLVKLEWYGTLFPRVPVPIQKDIERKLQAYKASKNWNQQQERGGQATRSGGVENDRWQQPQQQQAYNGDDGGEPSFGEAERISRRTDGRDSSRPGPPPPRRSPPPRDSHHSMTERHSQSRHESHRSHSSRHSPDRRHRSRSRSHHREKRRSRSRESRHVSKSREHRSRSRDGHRASKSREEKRRSRSHEHRHKKSRDHRSSSRHRESSKYKNRSRSPDEDGFEKDLEKEMKRVRQLKGSDSHNGKH